MTRAQPGVQRRQPLPIDAVVPSLLTALETHANAVLVAPPGAGKTTIVPLALLEAAWRGDNRIVVLEPRRLAARAAAQRMADLLGERVGDTVGMRMRLETKISARTRIEVVTEGVFTRLILNDPELTGIAAVLFDEFHERSLDGDLGLALALDVQSALREDLRLMPMSATIDAAPIAAHLGGAPVIESQGRSHPVDTIYLGRDPEQRTADGVARAVFKALREQRGSILAFLPGQGEIHQVAEQLAARVPADVDVTPLYGALDAKAQAAAIRAAKPGRRKVVLATTIAQTSITIEGVRVVVDAGLTRAPVYEPATGLTRLETIRVSKAAADQRQGRAGRTEPGVCYRLWDEAQTAALNRDDRPAILEADLSRFALDLAAWGVTRPDDLRFPDPPPQAAWHEAIVLLKRLNALDDSGRLTKDGERIAQLPLAPRLAKMLLSSGTQHAGQLASEIAVVLSEAGLGGRATDLRDRLLNLRRGSNPRSKAAHALARRWREMARIPAGDADITDAGRILALAFPDRVAQAQDGRGGFRMANGRAARLDEADPLARAPFLTLADVQGTAARGRILLAAPLDRSEIDKMFAADMTTTSEISCDGKGVVRARRITRYDRLVLRDENDQNPDPNAVTAALLAHVCRVGVGVLPWSKPQSALRARVTTLRALLGDAESDDWPDLTDMALTDTAADWLAPHMAGLSRLDEINATILGNALATLVPHHRLAALDRLLPSHFDAPSGSRVPIDYTRSEGPTLPIRVQEVFGLNHHPAIADGRVPLILELLSPAHRPIQITRDLPGFWRGSWKAVKSEMKGRYPKHPWPDDPAATAPTRRAKPRKQH